MNSNRPSRARTDIHDLIESRAESVRNLDVESVVLLRCGRTDELAAEDVADGNGFYQASVATTFPVGVVEVFCRTPRGVVAHGTSSAPLQDDAIRRRDIHSQVPRWAHECIEPEPGDIPPFRR
jgi:hypothetical protein